MYVGICVFNDALIYNSCCNCQNWVIIVSIGCILCLANAHCYCGYQKAHSMNTTHIPSSCHYASIADDTISVHHVTVLCPNCGRTNDGNANYRH